MLPKRNRLNKNEVGVLFNQGRFVRGDNLTLVYLYQEGGPKVSFIVPKKVAKLSNRRNYLRRIAYICTLPYLKQLPPQVLCAFTFNKDISDKETLSNEIKKLFDKIN